MLRMLEKVTASLIFLSLLSYIKIYTSFLSYILLYANTIKSYKIIKDEKIFKAEDIEAVAEKVWI